MPGTRKLGRPTASRMAMLRAMVTFLLEKGRIETTVTRAKEVRSMTEKMITIAKNPTLANKRLVYAFVTKESVSKKLFDEIAPKYMERNGGYTRIIKTCARRGDAAEMQKILTATCNQMLRCQLAALIVVTLYGNRIIVPSPLQIHDWDVHFAKFPCLNIFAAQHNARHTV